MLAEIPFVRLRHGLDEALLEGRSSFSKAVKQAQKTLGEAYLEINLAERKVVAQGVEVHLPPADLAFYSWLARRKLEDAPLVHCPPDGAPEPGYAREYLCEYRRIIGEMGSLERSEKTLRDGMTKAFFEQRKSRLHHRLKEALMFSAEVYVIHAVGERPRTQYQVRLKKSQMKYR